MNYPTIISIDDQQFPLDENDPIYKWLGEANLLNASKLAIMTDEHVYCEFPMLIKTMNHPSNPKVCYHMHMDIFDTYDSISNHRMMITLEKKISDNPELVEALENYDK